GLDAAIAGLPAAVRGNQEAVAETIANNVRARIVREHLRDPAFYDRMSRLLQGVIEDLRARRIEYAQYLQQIPDLARQEQSGTDRATPAELTTAGQRALFNNLGSGGARLDGHATDPREGTSDYGAARRRSELARSIHETVLRVRPAGWRG